MDELTKAQPVELEKSVQPRPDAESGAGAGVSATWLDIFGDTDELTCGPAYWSRQRDAWLREFATKAGNDLLIGTVATASAKVTTASWYLEGPQRTVNLYRDILVRRSDFGAGWSSLLQKLCFDYYTQDAGGWMERVRLDGSQDGAAIGFNAFDNECMWITGDPQWPARYQTSFATKDKEKQAAQLLHRSQVIHITDVPSPMEKLLGVGFCALSRALTTSLILSEIVRYERERLSDLPAAGLLLLNNMNQKQWKDVIKTYNLKNEQAGNQVWRRIMVLFGLDPAQPLTAEFFSFSQLPEHFDKRTWTELSVYAFALAFRMDPREIWPVSAGTLGTATEANIQHIKARAKGAGLVLTEVERAFNDGMSLPPSIMFKFDYQDTEEDQQAWEINNAKADFITKLTKVDPALGSSLVSVEEGRSWLVRQGLFDEEELMTMADEQQATDTERAKSLPYRVNMGPRIRAYRDGRTILMERSTWRGWSAKSSPAQHDPLAMAAQNYRDGRIDAATLAEYAIGLEAERRAGV